MTRFTPHILKEKKLLFISIIIAALLISTTTAVPQAQGQILNDQIDRYETVREFNNLLETVSTEQTDAEESNTYSMLITLSNKLIELLSNSENIAMTDIFSEDSTQELRSEEKSTLETENTILSLQTLLTDNLDELNDPVSQKLDFQFFQTLITWLINLLKNRITGDGDDGIPIGDGLNFIEILKSILASLSGILGILFKILAKGITGLITGIIKIIVSIVVVFLLFLAGIQTVLTLGAFFFLFLGIMAKIGIQAVSIIGAPLFAILSALISVSLGTIIGNLSMMLFSILALVVLFALPIGIAALIFYFISDGSFELPDFNFDPELNRTGLLYMILSVIANYLGQ
jgi:hypothetical protein